MFFLFKFAPQNVLVIGMAKSGIAAARVLVKKGARVTICDIKSAAAMSDIIKELKDSIEIWAGSYPLVQRGKYDLLVVSPGVPLNIEPIQTANQLGIPVIGELELAFLLKKPDLQMYAITGTNGKTTTTALLQAILAADGQMAVAGGNIGVPLTELVDSMEEGVIAVEASSFQLETTQDFKPHIAAILNITPDHLDRHKSMTGYIEAKAKIFARQNSDDFTILNYEDEILRNIAPRSKASIIYFSTDRLLDEGIFIKHDIITAFFKNTYIQICSIRELLLKGSHNLENVLCATAMALAADVKPEIIAQALKSFKGVRHRMEEVLSHEGVLYVNDSKATNPESAIKALEAFNKPIILIAGGRNKGSSFETFAERIAEKTKALILLGESKPEIKSVVMTKNYTNIYEVDNLDEAVIQAHKLANTGDVVLLSPACASWDMFANYEQRGDIFCNLAHSLCE